MFRTARRFTLTALALLGCGARSQLTCPSLPAADVVAIDAAPIDASHSDTSPDTGHCSVPLHVDSIDVPFGCVIDLHVGHDATLMFPCAGGVATAAFPAGTFAGTVAGGQVNLVLDTMFSPGDGCVWQTHQQIFGNLNAGALSYQYDEMPAPGQTGCLPPCPVSRAVLATPVSARMPVAPDAGGVAVIPNCEP